MHISQKETRKAATETCDHRRRRGLRSILMAAAVLFMAGAAHPAAAQDPTPSPDPAEPIPTGDGAQGAAGCSETGKNVQCTEFGTISMDSQRDIRGQPIDVTASVTLHTAYADRGARWVMFSVRNVTDDGTNPVTISLTRFATDAGDVVTTRIEHEKTNELNLWVDVLDTPVGSPITLAMQVGATERGAYRLETLVMAFDRGYAPIKDSAGNDASLFSFTLLGVNKETAKSVPAGSGSVLQGYKMPGFGVAPTLGVLAVATIALLRKRSGP